MIYLDYAASAPVRSKSLKVLTQSMTEDFANPSAGHKLGKNLKKRVEQARIDFIQLLQAQNNYKFIFTSSATESNNTAIKGIGLKKGEKVYCHFGDHPSLIRPLEACGVTMLPIPILKGGDIDSFSLFQNFDREAKAIVLAHVNNQTGNEHDILDLSKKIKQHAPNIHIHIDAVQSFGKLEINLNKNIIDTLSISSHKVGGPKGAGGLYVSNQAKCCPLLDGGGQCEGIRSSTMAAPIIYSFNTAAQEAFSELDQEFSKVVEIKSHIIKEIKNSNKDILFPFEEAQNVSPYILNMVVPNIPSDIILRHLEQKSIFISSSSACSSKIKGERPELHALKLDGKYHKNLLRVSFGHETTLDEVKIFIDEFLSVCQELKFLTR